MKKYFIITLALVLAFASCTDLEENPRGELISQDLGEIFQDASSVEASINGAYALLASEQVFGRKLTLTLLLRGDMVTIGDQTTASRRIEIDDFTATDGNGMVSTFWPFMFNSISAANNALRGLEIAEVTDAERAELEGQARFIRAFVYYHLVRTFGPVPYLKSLVSVEEALDLSRDSEEVVWQNIIEDFEFARDNLPDTFDGTAGVRGSSGAAIAYLASVHLTLGNMEEAYSNAKTIIDNQARYGFSLEPDFQDLFDATKVDNSTEHIFAIEFTGGDGTNNIGTDFLAPITGLRGFPGQEGWSVAVPSLEVFNSFEDGDYRKEVSFITSYDIEESDGQITTRTWEDFGEAQRAVSRPHIAKYFRFPGVTGNSRRDSDHNYIAMRYAEVLLIAAESGNQLFGPTAETVGYVNEIRARARNGAAGSTPSAVPADLSLSSFNQDSFNEAIIEERRIELAFEYKRWYDIKRLNIGEEVFGPNSLEPQPNFDPNRDNLLPVPAIEISRAPGLLPQNTGY